MRNRFARACAVLAAGIAVTSVIGLSAASTASAAVTPNATPACGFNCFNLSSLLLGRTQIQNVYLGRHHHAHPGTDVNLAQASNSAATEDFTGAHVGDLGDFCGSLLSWTSYVCIHYPSFYPVFESNWSPYGNESGLCVGARGRVHYGEDVTLQWCGSSPTTLWIGDLANGTIYHGRIYNPWVNGGSANFSHPLTLTVDNNSRRPSNQLELTSLNHLTGGIAPDSQQFTLNFGPVH